MAQPSQLLYGLNFSKDGTEAADDDAFQSFDLQLPSSGYKILQTIDSVLEPFPITFKVSFFCLLFIFIY
jgi:hypothetical protein